MKFISTDYRGRTSNVMSAEDAVRAEVQHADMHYEDQIARLKERIDILCGVVGRLVDATQNDATNYAREQAARVIGSQWDVKQ